MSPLKVIGGWSSVLPVVVVTVSQIFVAATTVSTTGRVIAAVGACFFFLVEIAWLALVASLEHDRAELIALGVPPEQLVSPLSTKP